MGLSYTHYLIPQPSDYRPDSSTIADFARELIARGNVPKDAIVSVSRVNKDKPRTIRYTDTVTGQIKEIPTGSRSTDRPQTLSDAAMLVEWAANETEYFLSIAGDGCPRSPPLDVGYVEGKSWKRFAKPYHLIVRCCVRSQIVRLYSLGSEADLEQRSFNFADYSPRFDEDCSSDETIGLFVHPELGPIRIPNAGCGRFWIEFSFGKFIFPRSRDGGVEVLDKSVLDLATATFSTEFVQACDWG